MTKIPLPLIKVIIKKCKYTWGKQRTVMLPYITKIFYGIISKKTDFKESNIRKTNTVQPLQTRLSNMPIITAHILG